MLAGVCVEFTADGCGVPEPVLVFTLMFVLELPLPGAAVEEPLLTAAPVPLPPAAGLLPLALLLAAQLLLVLPLLVPVLAAPPLPHPLTFPPD